MKQLTVREARDAKGWSQTKLADEAGLNKATVCRIESGEITNPSNDTVEALEVALKVKRGTLVFGQVMEKTA